MKTSRLLLITFVFALALSFNPLAQAQDQKLSLVHRPPESATLPLPGHPFDLRVILQGQRRTDLPVHAVLNIDGRLLDVTVKSQLDEYDRPVYTLRTRAPVAELSYTFLLYTEDGSVIGTPQYKIRRSCVPSTEPISTAIDAALSREDRAKQMVKVTRGLESDISIYTQAIEEMEKLKEMQDAEDRKQTH